MKTRKGMANMPKTQRIVNPLDKSQRITIFGFVGYKGWRLHPTKGWRKEAGFNAREARIVKT